jgi:hypothetical protein
MDDMKDLEYGKHGVSKHGETIGWPINSIEKIYYVEKEQKISYTTP